MSADVINLNKARKARAKEAALKLASSNRVKHARTGAEKSLERAEKQQFLERFENHRLPPQDAPDKGKPET